MGGTRTRVPQTLTHQKSTAQGTWRRGHGVCQYNKRGGGVTRVLHAVQGWGRRRGRARSHAPVHSQWTGMPARSKRRADVELERVLEMWSSS